MFYYGAAYYPEHRTEKEWRKDLDLMENAGVNSLRIAEFAWKRLEPSDGRYDFSWLRRFIDMAWEKKITSLVCPPMRTAPAWLVEKHPDVLIVNESGITLEFGSRYTFCVNNPNLVMKGIALAEKIAKQFGDHPGVCGWHLDNEYGDEPDCHCDACRKKWNIWLEKEYSRIDALNKAWGTVFWGTEFDSFKQVPTPTISKTYHNPALTQAWRRFVSESNIEIVKLHAEAIRKHSRNKHVTTNFQTWNWRTDYFSQQKNLDLCGTNYYPPFGTANFSYGLGLTNCRSYKKKPFHVFELRSGPHLVPGISNNTPAPGETEKLAVHAIANGADGLYYFAWRAVPFGIEQSHGTLLRHDGNPGKAYNECAEVGKKLKNVGRLIEGLNVQSEIGIFNDFQSWWMMDKQCPEWVGPDGMFRDFLEKIHFAVRQNGFQCDTVDCKSDFNGYKVLIAPFLTAFDQNVSVKILDFIRKGGVFIAHPFFGMKNPDAAIHPARIEPFLGKSLGFNLSEFATSGANELTEFSWQGKTYEGSMFFENPEHSGNAKVLAKFSAGPFKGAPAALEYKIHEGKFIFLCCFPEENFYKTFFERMLKNCKVRRPLACTPPDGVEVSERRNGKISLVFLINHSNINRKLRLNGDFYDIWNSEQLKREIHLKPHQARIVTRQGQT
jgi:beta-galactosidase